MPVHITPFDIKLKHSCREKLKNDIGSNQRSIWFLKSILYTFGKPLKHFLSSSYKFPFKLWRKSMAEFLIRCNLVKILCIFLIFTYFSHIAFALGVWLLNCRGSENRNFWEEVQSFRNFTFKSEFSWPS